MIPAQPSSCSQREKRGRTRATDPAILAAWTMVANVILNLDEAISKG